MTLDDELRNTPLNTFSVPHLQDVAALFARETRFEGKVVVNNPVMPGMLGIFFARFNSYGQQRKLRNNCVYVAGADDRHFVLCDVDYLTNCKNVLADAVDPLGICKATFESDAFSKAQSQSDLEIACLALFRVHLEYLFPRWVIGHEVGHAVLGHGGLQTLNQRQRRSKERELAADRFVIDHMVGDEKSRMHFHMGITALLYDWIRTETGKDPVKLGATHYIGPSVCIRDESDTHPPMILRLLNLIDAFLERFPDTDTTGYYSRLRKQIRVAQPVLCGSCNER